MCFPRWPAMTRHQWRTGLVGVVLGAGLTAAASQLPWINWQPIAPPIDARPLMIRHDAKGSGRFEAPRSGGRAHRGIDLRAELGSPVRALRSGVVLQIGQHRGLGRFVELEHANQLHSLYAHLDQIRVVPGARVRQGAIIGTVGKTGNARSPLVTPHLHVEVTREGRPLDPQTLGLRVVDSEPRETREASSRPATPPSSSGAAEGVRDDETDTGGE